MRFPLHFSRLLAAAASLAWTPGFALDLSQLDTAEAELEALVAEWQAEWQQKSNPASAKELAASLQALGMVERQAGKPDEALGHLTAACDLLATHAPDMLADAREARSLTLQDLGRLVDSENLLRQVLASRQETSASPKLAATFDHLALNLLYQGRYPEVAPLLDQAEAATPPADLAFRARIAAHRGRLYHTLGSHAHAAAVFQQALAIPFQDPELRLSLSSQLALTQLRLGKTGEARAGTEAAAIEARRLFANSRFRAVPYVNNLGALALTQDEPVIAKSAFQEALQMLEATLGTDHPGLIGPLNNLGVAEQALGDYPAARSHLERAAALQAKHLPATHLRVAETERNLARNSLLSASPDARDHIVRATRIGLDLLDRLIREGSENERLNFLERFDLVSLPCATGDAELIADVLIATKARLLDAMLADSKAASRPTWREVQAALPPGSAFIDTCRFTTPSTTPEERYGAIVILPSGPPKWVPLGTDESLAHWLGAFHERIRWRSGAASGNPDPPPALKIRGILRALEREFWAPLQLPPGTDHIAFSPDSRLHFLPIPALLDRENRPLSTRHLQIATVTSARDLINRPPAISLSGNPWTILTVSDFPQPSSKNSEDPLLALLADLKPMPGTRIEADKLRSLAPAGSRFLSGPQANESSLRQLPGSPSVLHFGCHAFFLQNNASPLGMPIDFDEHSDLLFAGGLVLYRGTERRLDSPRLADDDDLLFPSEIARLPLHDTRLVTLSSCESGAGTPVSGEGLLGLRRAFSLAGAREIVVALWPVSDDSTPGFMERFYQLALHSDRPAQALWQTQGEFLSAAAATDDDFELAVLRYAPFVLSQNSPLTIGPAITASQPPAASKRTWLAVLAALPLLLFIISRSLVKRKEM
jgi:CHAT domain-containing protein/tetratricopeptide (TPR) repeat protein